MNKFFFRTILGSIIWILPLITSFIVWDIENNAPAISHLWFNALMIFMFIIGFSISSSLWFKKYKKNTLKDGLYTGIHWYVQLSLLDLIVLVGAFNMVQTDYYPLLLTYLTVVPLMYTMGKLLEK